MAINRYEVPAQPVRLSPYVQQFVPVPYVGVPVDQIGAVAEAVQKRADENRAKTEKMAGLVRAIDVAPWARDRQVQEQIVQELQGRVDELSGTFERGYADRRYLGAIENMANQLGHDPRIKALKTRLEYYKEYQKRLQELQNKGLLHQDLPNVASEMQWVNQQNDVDNWDNRLEARSFSGMEELLDWRKRREGFFDNTHASRTENGYVTITQDGRVYHSTGSVESNRQVIDSLLGITRDASGRPTTQSMMQSSALRDYLTTAEGRQEAGVYTTQGRRAGLSGEDLQKYVLQNVYDSLVGTAEERLFNRQERDQTVSFAPEHWGGSQEQQRAWMVATDSSRENAAFASKFIDYLTGTREGTPQQRNLYSAILQSPGYLQAFNAVDKTKLSEALQALGYSEERANQMANDPAVVAEWWGRTSVHRNRSLAELSGRSSILLLNPLLGTLLLHQENRWKDALGPINTYMDGIVNDLGRRNQSTYSLAVNPSSPQYRVVAQQASVTLSPENYTNLEYFDASSNTWKPMTENQVAQLNLAKMHQRNQQSGRYQDYQLMLDGGRPYITQTLPSNGNNPALKVRGQVLDPVQRAQFNQQIAIGILPNVDTTPEYMNTLRYVVTEQASQAFGMDPEEFALTMEMAKHMRVPIGNLGTIETTTTPEGQRIVVTPTNGQPVVYQNELEFYQSFLPR